MRASLWDRFWAKVDTSAGADGCWPWTGAMSEKRSDRWGPTFRGVIQIAGRGSRIVLAHRLVLCLVVNNAVDMLALLADYDAPHEDGSPRQACHRPHCTTRLCCNPTHLYWGTHEQNRADRYQRIEREIHEALAS